MLVPAEWTHTKKKVELPPTALRTTKKVPLVQKAPTVKY